MQKTILIISILLAPFVLSAQSNFYTAIETNFVQDHFILKDEGSSLSEYPNRMQRFPGWNFLVGYQFNPYLSLETGMNFRPMASGYQITYEFSSTYNKSSRLYYQLPLRLRGRVPIFRDKLYATTNLGVQFGVTNFPLRDEPSVGSGSGSSSINSQTVFNHNSINTTYSRSFLLVGGGLGLEFSISPNWSI